MSWLGAVLVAVALVVACWALLIVAARRLPPGPLRDLVAFLPSCVVLIRALRGDPSVPRSAKVALGIAIVWVLSPIDLIPEFLPVIGPLDDLVVVTLALRFAARRVPEATLVAAWPEPDPSLLLRSIGRRPPEDAAPS